jgi:hypothetical protein
VKKNRSIIILFSVLGVVLLVYFIFDGQGEKTYQWRENYKTTSDQPYGTMFIKQLLESYRPGEKFVFNDKKPLHQLLDSAASLGSADYIFIGQSLYLDNADIKALLNFIHSGNDAFVASIDLPYFLMDSIYANECDRPIFYQQREEKSVTMNFYHNRLKKEKGYPYAFRSGTLERPYYWNVINPAIFCDSTKSVIALGYQQPDHVNFAKLPYGDGNLYVHTNPLVFTNYFIAKQKQAEYAAAALSHLRGKSIIWDEFSKSQISSENAPNISPLSYILQHPSLKYAWWMMLASAILYTLFTAKRKQRTIPVLEEKVNTSLEFVKMISALHFQNANHLDIARKKMKYFLYFIRAKYGMYTQNFTEEHFKRLAEKSKIDLQEIKSIFNEFQIIERNPYNTPSAERLLNLYNAIDHFYKNCK